MKTIGIIAGVLLTLSGGYCFSHPVLTFGSLGWLIGVSILVYGIGCICTWMDARKQNSATAWELVSAILAIVIAILILVNIKALLFTDTVLIALIGIWLAATGILCMVAAVKLKPSWWGLSAIWGGILVLTAIASLIHPMVAIVSLGWCIAFAMMTQGINLVIAVCLKPKDEGKS